MTEDITSDTPAASTPKITSLSRRRRREKPFEWLSEPYNSVRGESALWVAVIMQAMMDALSNARNTEAAYHKQQALHWLRSDNADFAMVCLLAGFTPEYIRRQVKKTLACPRPWRALPGEGSRYHERKRYRERLKEVQSAQDESSNVIVGSWWESA